MRRFHVVSIRTGISQIETERGKDYWQGAKSGQKIVPFLYLSPADRIHDGAIIVPPHVCQPFRESDTWNGRERKTDEQHENSDFTVLKKQHLQWPREKNRWTTWKERFYCFVKATPTMAEREKQIKNNPISKQCYWYFVKVTIAKREKQINNMKLTILLFRKSDTCNGPERKTDEHHQNNNFIVSFPWICTVTVISGRFSAFSERNW